MDNRNISTFSLIAVIFSLLLLLGFVATRPVIVKEPAPPQDFVGALSGPTISSPFLSWGGVPQYNFGPTINATSSVFCAIQNTMGTSTLDSIGLRVDSNGLGAQNIYVSTSTVANKPAATSTPALLASVGVPATINPGAPFVVGWRGVASTTNKDVLGANVNNTDGSTVFLWKTGEYLNFTVATTTGGVFSSYMTGQCTVRSTKL